jgi:formylmethanofuran dehydrogenase subunit B
VKEKCSPKTAFRTIIRGEYDSFSDEVDEFTKQNLELYAKRKSMVEHPFGTIKRSLGFTYFLTRGTENVKTESFLHFMAYNLKRLINIVGVIELKLRLQS